MEAEDTRELPARDKLTEETPYESLNLDATGIKVSLVFFSPVELVNIADVTLNTIQEYREREGVLWLSVSGTDDHALIKAICGQFGIHPLVQEDILNANHRAKREEYPGHLFMVLRSLCSLQQMESRQISIVLGRNFILTFEEKNVSIFDDIRRSLGKSPSPARRQGADYLIYELLHCVVESYPPEVEALNSILITLEKEVFTSPNRETLGKIHNLNKSANFLRYFFWPLREVVNGLERNDSGRFKRTTLLHIRDVRDRLTNILESVESISEAASRLLHTYSCMLLKNSTETIKTSMAIFLLLLPLIFSSFVYATIAIISPSFNSTASLLYCICAIGWLTVFVFHVLRKKNWI